MFDYDPELPAGFQDADLEMRELEQLGNEQARKGTELNGAPIEAAHSSELRAVLVGAPANRLHWSAREKSAWAELDKRDQQARRTRPQAAAMFEGQTDIDGGEWYERPQLELKL